MAVTVTYNGAQLPSVIGAFSLSESYNEIGFSCNFLVEASSSSALVSACSALEEKLREPFEALTINFGGTGNYSFSHDDNTCLNSEASFAKTGGETDAETSRVYSFSFRSGLPADKDGFNFRRRGDFAITELATGQKVVQFNLEYTASASPKKTSLENFDSHAVTYAESVLSSLFPSDVFDKGIVSRSADQEQKICSGTITYTELFEPESLAGTNDANLKNVLATYNVDRGQRVGVSSGGYVAIPVTRVSVRYSAELVKANFASSEAIHEYYLSNIKPHIVQRAIVNLSLENIENTSAGVIVESDAFFVDPVKYSVSGTMTFLAPSSSTAVIKLEESIREEFDSGIVTQKMWDGVAFSKSGYHLGSDLMVTRSIVVEQLGQPPTFPNILSDPDLILKKRIRSGTRSRLAANTEVGERDIPIFSEAFVEIYEKAVLIEGQPIPIPNPNPVTFVPEG